MILRDSASSKVPRPTVIGPASQISFQRDACRMVVGAGGRQARQESCRNPGGAAQTWQEGSFHDFMRVIRGCIWPHTFHAAAASCCSASRLGEASAHCPLAVLPPDSRIPAKGPVSNGTGSHALAGRCVSPGRSRRLADSQCHRPPPN